MSAGSGQPAIPAAPTEPALWVDETVQVAERDVQNLSLLLRTGARLSGRVRFEGAAQPAAEQIARMAITLRSLSAGPTPLSIAPTRLETDGRFVTAQQLPGRYALTIPAPSGWTLRSVTVGGRNVSGWPIEIGATDIDNVEVAFGDQSASLTGAIRAAAGQRAEPATVVVFPADVQRFVSQGVPAALRRSIATGENGSFTATGLFEGEYLVVAVDASQAIDLENPAVYASLARAGTRITIAAGGQAHVALTPVSLR
jgi:hypothetical protein